MAKSATYNIPVGSNGSEMVRLEVSSDKRGRFDQAHSLMRKGLRFISGGALATFMSGGQAVTTPVAKSGKVRAS